MRTPCAEEVCRLVEYLGRVAASHGTVTYAECMHSLAIGELEVLVALLCAVQQRHDQLGCDLSALVVNRRTGRPGRGWERGACEDWDSAVARCYGAYRGHTRDGVDRIAEGSALRASARQLPYDPGNSGDLLKHAWLAVLVRWLLSLTDSVLSYADPFAGEWDYELLPAVARRFGNLRGTLLAHYSGAAWQQGRYLGSTGLVGTVASLERRPAQIWVGDKCKDRVARLVADHGCRELPEPQDGYAVLRRSERYDLLLIDPFADFLDEAPRLVPEIVARAADCSMLLFIVSPQHSPHLRARCADALRQECRRRGASVIGAGIAGPSESAIRGERGHDMEVVFLPRADLEASTRDELLAALSAAAAQVAAALGDGIEARVWRMPP